MPHIDRAIVIYSPHSGKATYLEEALAYLRRHKVTITDVVAIADLDGLPAQGPVWKAGGADVVIAAGGDGVVGGVITHIMADGLPLGMANDIARTLRIPQDIQQATETIMRGRIIGADVGMAQPAEQAPHRASRHTGRPGQAHVLASQQSYFAHVLTIGLNVQFARMATNITTRQRFGWLTYPIAALEALKNYGPVELEIEVRGLALPRYVTSSSGADTNQTEPTIVTEPVRFQCKTLQATVVNAPIFGGQWQFALPKASMEDHLLDIVLIADIKLETLVGAIGQLFRNLYNPTSIHSDWHIENAPHPLLQQAELSGVQGVYHFQAEGVVI